MSASWVAPNGKGGGQRGSCPRALALVPRLPTEKILIVIKCPLVTIHMPRCNLLKVIFARQYRYL